MDHDDLLVIRVPSTVLNPSSIAGRGRVATRKSATGSRPDDHKQPDGNDKPTIPRLFEAAWANAFPGREAAERNAVLRELSQLQQ